VLVLTDFIIDCPDTLDLAGFYADVTGRPVREGSTAEWAGISYGEVELAFQRVDDFRPPHWPDDEHPKQFHLDFEVDDLPAEQERVLGLGATLVQDFLDADGYGWRVYTDPVGHPFCLCRNRRAVWSGPA
jgi:predicted enzyme related to lactoylglutathione lyase